MFFDTSSDWTVALAGWETEEKEKERQAGLEMSKEAKRRKAEWHFSDKYARAAAKDREPCWKTGTGKWSDDDDDDHDDHDHEVEL